MEELREQFQYKEDSIEICFKSLTPIEQYEVIRLITAFPNKLVYICTHDNVSSYIESILKNITVAFKRCFDIPAL